jgi:hypothetical protein
VAEREGFDAARGVAFSDRHFVSGIRRLLTNIVCTEIEALAAIPICTDRVHPKTNSDEVGAGLSYLVVGFLMHTVEAGVAF